MNDHDVQRSLDVSKDPMPSDLIAAIERARQRTASSEMVTQLTVRVSHLNKPDAYGSIASSYRQGRWLMACAVAASIFVIVSYGFIGTAPSDRVSSRDPNSFVKYPIYSQITKVSFVQVGYRRIEEDLDLADAKAERVSEGLVLAALRQEIQESLEEFYKWSD